MKSWIWKLSSLLLLLILIVLFFVRNLQTTSQVDFLVTAVTIKTWQLIVISFFLGGIVFCGVASIYMMRGEKKKRSSNQGSEGSS